MNPREIIEEILNKHSLKAQHSTYDSDTCISAIIESRARIALIPEDISNDSYPNAVIEALSKLSKNYHDSDGEYTSGRSVIVALLDEIYQSFLDE